MPLSWISSDRTRGEFAQSKTVVPRPRGRLARQAGAPQRAVEEIPGAIAGEHAACAVGSVSSRSQTKDQQLRLRITESSGGAHADAKSPSLLLLGGCDLLQLASYCSNDRIEFVNRADAGATVRYDDPGFILSDREAARNCESLNRLPLWTSQDAERFDEAVASRGMIIVSLWAGMVASMWRMPATAG